MTEEGKDGRLDTSFMGALQRVMPGIYTQVQHVELTRKMGWGRRMW